MNYRHINLLLSFITFYFSLAAQTNSVQSIFDPHELFAQNFYTKNGNEFRSANGAPGVAYWQNRASYLLHATIDTVSNILSASETIHYSNNSPDALSSLWLEIDQNNYREDARSNFYTASSKRHSTAPGAHTDGYHFDSVTIQYKGKIIKADYIINDTRMQLRLQGALSSKDKIDIHIHYHYTIPGTFGGRTDFFSTKNGKIYEIAQWYPRMCVYDDLHGWNTLPFLGSGEFYCEYGDFDYTITVPAGMIVEGSGELQNEKEVLTSQQIRKLNEARKSDKTIMIRTADEVNHQTISTTNKMASWHFKMFNTRDVAFGASKAYMWDAAKVNLPGGKTSLAMSVYPVESAGDSSWVRATEYLKKSIEYFSEKWFVYPYPVAVNEAGMAGGMEYPGIVFDGWQDEMDELYWVTAHEIGHNWFPMIVGSDERRYAWMDEGFNTFIDVYAADAFNNGEYAPKRDGEYAPKKGNPADEIIPLLKDSTAPTMMMASADMLTEKYRHPLEYFKPAFGLVLLREVILGNDRFDYAFKRYIEHWAYKHPSPDDFFRTMESEAGEDLSWFWKEWFYNNWQFDVAVQSVLYTNDDAKNGADITIINLQKMALPIMLEIVLKDGSKMNVQLPIETWLQSNVHIVHVQITQAIKSVTIDPENKLPDSNRDNNYVTKPLK